MGRCAWLAALALWPLALWAQNDAAANAQHLILGQQASGATQLASRRNAHPEAQWFPKAGLGLFIHMGIASVHGGIDLSWGMLAGKSWEDGEITPEAYWALADRWDPVNFRPAEWARLAKEAGFRYVVFTTKHHDGYTLWPSAYGELGVRQKLGGRDLVKEVVEACRANGLKVGLYYSPPDWYFDRDYRDFGRKNGKPVGLRHEPLDKIPPKPAGHDAARRAMVANHVRELLTRYGKIDVMWFDGGQREITNEEIRRLQPGIVINRRNGELGDFGDSEGVLPTHRPQGWFECNDPCWPSRWWSYSCSDRMDSGADVIEKLVIMRAWGGNFLANVGPGPDGAMPPEALAAWKEMAAWMRHSGESVHDVTGGGFPETANQPVTVRGDGTLYVHAFPNFHKAITVRDLPKRPVRATLLRTGDAIPFTYDNATLTLQIPPRLRSRMVDTVRVSLQ